ncbi:MAG TPA: hypothetical protein VLT92_16680 [Burkholderiales bacterium]|nr:hypothetical protein [Burkholderiales bacterium]
MSQSELQELERLAAAARDSLTDDTVSRLSAAAAEGLDALDRFNRSGVAAALPALAELVRNGDLDRLVQLARTYGAGQDAVTDEMVSRLTETVAGGLDLLDRANRAELGRVIPVLARLVANGDLERVTHLARVVGAAEDAVTDDMISRLSETVSGVLSIADRLNRAGADRIIGALERLAAGGGLDRLDASLQRLGAGMVLLERVVGAVDGAATESRAGQASAGGVSGMWRLLRDPETQETLRFQLAVGRRLKAGGARR